MEISRKNLILNLKRLRGELSQLKMAEKVGLSHRQYVRYENGDSWPPPETLAKIAKALSVSAEDLIADPNKPAPTAQALTPETLKAIQAATREALRESMGTSDLLVAQAKALQKQASSSFSLLEEIGRKQLEVKDLASQHPRNETKIRALESELNDLFELHSKQVDATESISKEAAENAMDVLRASGNHGMVRRYELITLIDRLDDAQIDILLGSARSLLGESATDHDEIAGRRLK